MAKDLSIIKPEKLEDEGSDTTREVGAAFLKSLAGYAPFVGPILGEAIGFTIPSKKVERLYIFAQVFEDRLQYVEEDVARLKMQTEEFTDLLEDGLIQASRAMTDERRGYIASLLKNSITHDELSHVEKKKLLALLGEINDAEVIVLKLHSLSSQDDKSAFAKRHESVLAPIPRPFGVSQEILDKGAFQDSYRSKLMEVGLLTPVYKQQEKGKMPEFDDRTGRLKATSFRVTALAGLLLRFIDESPAAEATLVAEAVKREEASNG
jgi:hypothetical protein